MLFVFVSMVLRRLMWPALGVAFLSACTTAERLDQSEYPVVTITPAVIAQLTPARTASPAPIPSIATTYAYRIGAGDVLTFRLADGGSTPDPRGYLDTFAQAVPIKVEDNGTASFPYIGVVTIDGLTTNELRTLVAKKLSTYFRNPRFDVQLQEFHSHHILVSGAVMKPGNQYLGYAPLDVATAIEKAGGTQPVADLSDVTIVHANGAREKVNVQALLYHADAGQNPILRDGDTLLVSENHRNRIFLMGDIMKPGSMAIPVGHLSLTEAVNEANGPNDVSATTVAVYVIRGAVGEGDAPAPADQITIYRLDTDVPTAYALADKFPLQPRDVVYVAAAPVTEWHRFISQLIPNTISASRSFN